MTGLHDPYPDGRSGPWLRSRHARSFSAPVAEHGGRVLDQGYAFDARCAECRRLVWAGQQWTHTDKAGSPARMTLFVDGEEVGR